MPRSFAIGDLHGCSKTFRKLVLEKINLQKTDVLYCLGDYVDRGPDSKGVIDFILELREQGYTVHALRGNHDQMMMDSGLNMEKFMHWYRNGGKSTLESFGVRSYDQLNTRYKDFFYHTTFFEVCGSHILVHAGLNFKNDDPFSDTESMMWIRGFRVDEEKLNGRLIVHGHTPIPLKHILEQKGQNVIDIDGGCVYPHLTGYGHLVAYNMSDGTWIVVENCE